MGQYFCLVNESRREYAHSPSVMKLWEWAVNSEHRLFVGALLSSSWNCDRVALVGDYNQKRVTWDELEAWKEIFPKGKGLEEREKEILSFCKKKGFKPVYFCLDRNEYIAQSEIGGDSTNVLGVLIYLLAYSFSEGEPEETGSILARWAFCKIEARDSIPEGARSISREGEEFLKEERAFVSK